MKFEYKRYFSNLFTVPIIEFVVENVILIIVIIKFINTPILTITNVLFIITCLILIFISITCLRYGIFLLIEKENNKTTFSGVIEKIENVIYSPKYIYMTEKKVKAKKVIVDDKKLYFMSIGDLNIGNKIKVEYLPKSSIVLKVELLSKL